MNVAVHRAKAERIERSLRALTPADYEAIIEGSMLAGTHWFNLLLHHCGLASANADAMHAEFLSVGARRRIMVRLPKVLAAMDCIEALRTTHVRGDLPDGMAAGRQALDALSVLRNEALAVPLADVAARP